MYIISFTFFGERKKSLISSLVHLIKYFHKSSYTLVISSIGAAGARINYQYIYMYRSARASKGRQLVHCVISIFVGVSSNSHRERNARTSGSERKEGLRNSSAASSFHETNARPRAQSCAHEFPFPLASFFFFHLFSRRFVISISALTHDYSEYRAMIC